MKKQIILLFIIIFITCIIVGGVEGAIINYINGSLGFSTLGFGGNSCFDISGNGTDFWL